MNEADDKVCDAYVGNRDEMTDEYLLDLVDDIWKELEERRQNQETILGHE